MLTDELEWLDVRCSVQTQHDLFGEHHERFVQFRYVSVDGVWHLGRFGESRPDNYAPFKAADTWKTKAAGVQRPIISACGTDRMVSHEWPSRVAVASADVAPRICPPCLQVLTKLRDELAELCEFEHDEFAELADHVLEFGNGYHHTVVSLANAFEGVH